MISISIFFFQLSCPSSLTPNNFTPSLSPSISFLIGLLQASCLPVPVFVRIKSTLIGSSLEGLHEKRFRLEVFIVDVQDFSGIAIYLIQLVNNVWPIKLRDPICSYIEQIKIQDC